MQKRGKEISRENNLIVKGIIPAAGLGTRLQPLTFSIPKELLPVNRKAMIHWAVEEAISAGIRDIGIVIRKGKEAIRAYFENLTTASDSLCTTPKVALSEATLQYIYQEKPLGIGNALYEAKSFINDTPFVMIIPDQFLSSKVTATEQLLEVASNDTRAVWNSVVSVSPHKMHFFPGARSFLLSGCSGNTWEVKGFGDNPQYSGRSLIGFGRTFFPSGVLKYFSEKYINPATAEVDLLLSFEALFGKFLNYAVLLQGEPIDFGTWPGYEHFFSSGLCFAKNCLVEKLSKIGINKNK